MENTSNVGVSDGAADLWGIVETGVKELRNRLNVAPTAIIGSN